MMWRVISAKPIARHVIDTHSESSVFEFNGGLWRGKQYATDTAFVAVDAREDDVQLCLHAGACTRSR